MKIGIDLDGVVFDSEQNWRVYEEIYAIEDINKKIINKEEPKYQGRYDWTAEEKENFNKKYLRVGAQDCSFNAGFFPVYKRLKDMGLELIVITARGMFIEETKEDAQKMLKEHNIVFDKYYWNTRNKLEICKQENIDVMIDDDYRIIEQISNEKIKTLYFRDANIKRLKENEYIKEVNNWGDIYRYFIELKNK